MITGIIQLRGDTMSFVAVYMPYDGEDAPIKTKIGFATKENAWKYIQENFVCSRCLRELADGGYESERNGEKAWVVIAHVYSTGCGAEWIIITQEEWEASGEDPFTAFERGSIQLWPPVED